MAGGGFAWACVRTSFENTGRCGNARYAARVEGASAECLCCPAATAAEASHASLGAGDAPLVAAILRGKCPVLGMVGRRSTRERTLTGTDVRLPRWFQAAVKSWKVVIASRAGGVDRHD